MGHNLTLEILEKQLKADNELLDIMDKRLSALEDILEVQLLSHTAKSATEMSFLNSELNNRLHRFKDNVRNLRSAKDSIVKRKRKLLNELKEYMGKSSNDLLDNVKGFKKTEKDNKKSNSNRLIDNIREV